MSYNDFLQEFAVAHKVDSVSALLSQHAIRYSFQINSRKRAIDAINEMKSQLNFEPENLRVLDIGCAYGSFCVEFAKLGADVVGVDISDKWLRLAEINAKDDAECKFYNLDASTRHARDILAKHGPFDIVVINDVFEHIYDTVSLLENVGCLMKNGGYLYFKVPNGLATRSVISEGHKKVFGISLIAPDYWGHFITFPFHIYYRRWPYFESLFKSYHFTMHADLTPTTDTTIEQTRKMIKGDISKAKRLLVKENFDSMTKYKYIRDAFRMYIYEAERDMEELDWPSLFRKYRATFWTGILQYNPPSQM